MAFAPIVAYTFGWLGDAVNTVEAIEDNRRLAIRGLREVLAAIVDNAVLPKQVKQMAGKLDPEDFADRHRVMEIEAKESLSPPDS
jgi:hypothetical protein